jgi:hypothetical protein
LLRGQNTKTKHGRREEASKQRKEIAKTSTCKENQRGKELEQRKSKLESGPKNSGEINRRLKKTTTKRQPSRLGPNPPCAPNQNSEKAGLLSY